MILNIIYPTSQTHIDIVEDFDQDLIDQLVALSQKHDFLIFEDRKFADIGNTVILQYSRGVHRISSWSHITNAHLVPGPSIISGLASVGLPLGRGLLLLAEMSSEGTLAAGAYTQAALDMARTARDFVIGFIAMQRFDPPPPSYSGPPEDWLILTPGVGLDVIKERGCDIIIVGRGIYGRGNGSPSDVIARQAERYRMEGWVAYEERLQ
ncbi:hypothetical protein BS47DRAFT_1343495 [Hydnum rufescens UP504]|uniref:Orotidine 5'-phosphate decarboxylase n=1 Tax=Hydnum rufescens UP504 TaxID=1448309 RepID=A0A9P6AY50_9AGAM|nr:hypothetical protein BS47DRAFT_1343495 [Hydnum rufescens UP504]